MKSTFTCPACSQILDWIPLDGGHFRLFCGSVHCANKICADGVEVESRWGQDVNDAHHELVRLFEKMKGKHEQEA